MTVVPILRGFGGLFGVESGVVGGGSDAFLDFRYRPHGRFVVLGCNQAAAALGVKRMGIKPPFDCSPLVDDGHVAVAYEELRDSSGYGALSAVRCRLRNDRVRFIQEFRQILYVREDGSWSKRDGNSRRIRTCSCELSPVGDSPRAFHVHSN